MVVSARWVSSTMIRVQTRAFAVKAKSRVLQFASTNFDASLSEIFMALSRGAALHLAPRSAMLPGPDLTALCREREITHLTLTPSALAVMPAGSLASVETLIVAGEDCPAELASRWSTGRRFLNAYGPTETSVCATISDPIEANDIGPPAIGRPIAGNPHLPSGSNLETSLPPAHRLKLYIAGLGLARGYLARPRLTAERWISQIPSAENQGARTLSKRETGEGGWRLALWPITGASINSSSSVGFASS